MQAPLPIIISKQYTVTPFPSFAKVIIAIYNITHLPRPTNWLVFTFGFHFCFYQLHLLEKY